MAASNVGGIILCGPIFGNANIRAAKVTLSRFRPLCYHTPCTAGATSERHHPAAPGISRDREKA